MYAEKNVDRSQKEALVASMNGIFDTASSVVVTHYSGLNVAEITELRSRMRAAGAQFKVTKNRLVRRALEGTKVEGLLPLFEGPTAIAFSDDPVMPAKIAVKFAKENQKLIVLGGTLDDKILDTTEVDALAQLPSLDEQRAIIIGLLQAPATKIAGVLAAPAGQLARVLGAQGAKGEAA